MQLMPTRKWNLDSLLPRWRGAVILCAALGVACSSPRAPERPPTAERELIPAAPSASNDDDVCCTLSDLLYEPSVNQQIATADTALASNDVAKALRIYEQATTAKDRRVASTALYRLGEIYARGRVVRRDLARAVAYFKSAARLG